MKTTLLLMLATLAPGLGQFRAQAQDTTPPFLVSAASLNGTNVGLRFSEPMNRSGLDDVSSYSVEDASGQLGFGTVSIRPGDSAVVIHINGPVSSPFTVTIQSPLLSDRAGNPLPVGLTVTGTVWSADWALADVGFPSPPGELSSCFPGQLAIDASGRNIGDTADQFTYVYGSRTNNFDLSVRVDGLLNVGHPTAKAGIHIRQSLAAGSPFFMLYLTPTNGSNYIELRGRSGTGQGHWYYLQPPPVDTFPVWLRVKRSGRTLTAAFSRDGQSWQQVGGPEIMAQLPAVSLVGLGTVSHVEGTFTGAEYRDFGDTLLYPGAQITITKQPTNATVEAHLSASFSVVASVTDAPTNALEYQWQAEESPGSGVFTNAWFATASSYRIPLLNKVDSGTRVRVLVSISGHPPVVSDTVILTVSPDTSAPHAVSALGTRSLREIVVAFSEPLDPLFAQQPLRYTVSGFSVTSATLDRTGTKVVLGLDGKQALGGTNVVQIADVRDLAGHLIDPNPQSVSAAAFVVARGLAAQELYFDIPSYEMAALRSAEKFPSAPDESSYVSLLEGPLNVYEDYGTRISGFLVPPVSANYHFFMCSDDEGEFWLSTDDEPANLVRICHEPIWMESRGYTNITSADGTILRNASAPENRSATLFPAGIPLVAGRIYYFEALAKEGGGGDNLAVAWQLPGMPMPETGSTPISGEYLACLAPQVETSLIITQQLTNLVYDFTPLITEPTAHSIEDFTTNDGGYTVLTPLPFAGPWSYDGANGVWHADGDTPDAGHAMTSRLRTPPILVARTGVVQVAFRHRYSFEFDGTRFDGGNLRISVNGGPFTLVPASAFLTNGYNNTVASFSNAEIAGQPAFTETSQNHGSGVRVLSTAALGYFNPGDTIIIEFTYSGDTNTRGAVPNWEIDRVTLSEGHPGRPLATFSAPAVAFRADFPDVPVFYQWQRACGAGFTNILGAKAASYSFLPAAADLACQFRVIVTTFGLSVTSAVVRITIPPIQVQATREGANVVVRWNGPGTLQNAQNVIGPWLLVGGVTNNTFSVRPTAASRFYRVRVP